MALRTILDLPETLIKERDKYYELFNLGTTKISSGNLTFASTSSGKNYDTTGTIYANTGQIGLMNLLFNGDVSTPSNPKLKDYGVVSSDMDEIRNNIGTLASLTTTDKSSVVGAVNELKSTVETGVRSAIVTAYLNMLAMPANTRNGLVRGAFSGVTLNNAVANGDVDSSLTATGASRQIGITTAGAIVVESLYNATHQLFNIDSGNKYFVMAKAKQGTFGDFIILKYSDATQEFINPSGGLQNSLIYGIITPTKSLKANLKLSEGTYSGTLEKDFEMLINMTALGLDSLTADEMKVLCSNGYFEGLKGSDVELRSAGKNLINKDTSSINFTLSSVGVLTASTVDDTTASIRVQPSTSYYLSGKTTAKFYALYDKQGNFISSASVTNSLIATTASTAFVKVSYLKSNASTVQLELGSSATAYESYRNSSLSLDKEMNRVPNAVADNYNSETGLYTQNVKPYELVAGDITTLYTLYTNFDLVVINRANLVGIKAQTSAITSTDAKLVIPNFSPNTINFADVTGQTGTYTDSSGWSGQLQLVVAKGTYASLASAQTALAGTKILYQLATPIVTELNKDLASFENGSIWQQGLLPCKAEYTTPINVASAIADNSKGIVDINNRMENWKTVDPWIAPTLLNGWVNFDTTYAPASYYKDEFGTVHLKGLIKSGSVSPSITYFTLPMGFRPPKNIIVNSMCYNNTLAFAVDLAINSDGTIKNGFVTPGNNWLSLDGITFKAV